MGQRKKKSYKIEIRILEEFLYNQVKQEFKKSKCKKNWHRDRKKIFCIASRRFCHSSIDLTVNNILSNRIFYNLRDHPFKIFDPYPPTIGIPAKCFWRGFLILMYCDLLTIGTRGHPSPPKTCWRLKWMVPNITKVVTK